ncbi:MAG: TonB-dependent receptor, partial [bacterium]
MRRLMLAVAAALMVSAVAVESAETNTEIVVTASRNNRQASQIPANVTVMTAADIEKAGYGNIVEVLRDTGGMSLRSTSGNESQSEMQMRGFGENSEGRVLVLLDGRKLNRPDMAGINWLQVPLGNVDRVEVLRGSDSVSFGDHAVGGVVNIVTKKGTRAPEASAHVLFGSYGENVERAGCSGSSEKLSYAFNMERQEIDGYRDRSAFSTIGAGGNLSYDLSDEWNAVIATSFNKAEYQLPGWLTKSQMEADPTQSTNPSDNAVNKYFDVNFNTTYQFGSRGSAALAVVFGRTDVSSDMTSWFSYADSVIDSFGAMPSCVLNTSVFGHKDKLLLGVDYYIDSLNVGRFSDAGRLNETSTAEIRKKTLGAYFKNELNLSDSLVLGAGARVEQANVSGWMSTNLTTRLFDDTRVHDANAVNVSLIYKFGQDSKIFTRLGTLYRYPFVDEQVFYSGFGADHFNPNLKAEAGTDLQLGVDAGVGNSVRAGLTLFLMNMRDEIAYNPVTSDNENMDKTRHSGAEANVSWKVCKALSADANYTYTASTFTGGANDGKVVPLVPAHAASLGATLSLPWEFSFRTAIRYTGG